MENDEPSLGDILGAALAKKEITVSREILSILVSAGRKTGRSSDMLWNMLASSEKDLILNEFCRPAEPMRAATRESCKVYLAPEESRKIHRKIDCIKEVRAITGLALKEAKDFVEGHRDFATDNSEIVTKLASTLHNNYGCSLYRRASK